MSDAIQLDRDGRRRTWNAFAIVAIILGLCSGPIAIILVRFTLGAYGSEGTLSWAFISIVSIGISCGVGLVAFVYCIWVCVGLRRRLDVLGRNLAWIGLVATVLWSILTISLYCCFEMQHRGRMQKNNQDLLFNRQVRWSEI